MKLTRQPSFLKFNPDNLVTSVDILGKKVKTTGEEGIDEEKKIFVDTGLFSKRIFGDVESTENEYACECKNLSGKFYEGAICPKCHTPVQFIEPHLNKIGWIDLSGNKYDENGLIAERGREYHIIKYYAYQFLEKVIGRKNLKMIITVPNTITASGELNQELIQQVQEEKEEQKYWFIGLSKFYENYNEILTYYYKLHKEAETEAYEFLQDPIDVWTDKIPVISALLRPAMRTEDGLKLDELNNIYIRIITQNNILNSKTNNLQIIQNSALASLQAQYMILNEKVLDVLKGKDGLIRNNICGARVFYTARNIISPADPETKMDELEVPYLTFLELYKFELINILCKVKDISIMEASEIHFKAALEFNEEIYLMMQKIIQDEEVGVILNRNPTIAYGSMLYLRITKVKKDMTDFTMGVNNLLLSSLAGDYDGDVLNLISIKDKSTKKRFKEVFSPVRMLIDPNNGKFNNTFGLKRDRLLGLNNLLL